MKSLSLPIAGVTVAEYITALGDQLIFAASGTTGNAGFKGIAPWDAHTIARDVFRKYAAKRRQQPMFSSISQEWAKRVKNHIKVEVKKYRNEVLPWIIGNSFISAVFAGFYNGSPYITIAAVTYDVSEDGKGKVQSSITKTITKPTSVMLGRNEIADELFAGKTERAQEWRKSLTPVTTDDGYAFAAIKAVEFSIENYPLVNIKGEMLPPLGGPVDAVRLRRTGGIDWIQKKENCPAN
jgi:hypothetical protein